jgi:hypothetical protein
MSLSLKVEEPNKDHSLLALDRPIEAQDTSEEINFPIF